MFAVTPNPATDELTVTFEGNEQDATTGTTTTLRNLVLVDMQGTIHKQWRANRSSRQLKLNIASVRPGTYILRITTAGVTNSATIIKQ